MVWQPQDEPLHYSPEVCLQRICNGSACQGYGTCSSPWFPWFQHESCPVSPLLTREPADLWRLTAHSEVGSSPKLSCFSRFGFSALVHIERWGFAEDQPFYLEPSSVFWTQLDKPWEHHQKCREDPNISHITPGRIPEPVQLSRPPLQPDRKLQEYSPYWTSKGPQLVTWEARHHAHCIASGHQKARL